MTTYIIIFVLLLIAELVYFRIGYYQDRRYNMADILISIWCGWLFDNCSPNYAA